MNTKLKRRQLFAVIGFAHCLFGVGCGPALPEPQRGIAATEPCPVDGTGKMVMLPESIEAPQKWLDTYDSLLRRMLRASDALPLWCGTGGDAYRVIAIPASRPVIVAEVSAGTGNWTASTVSFADPRTSEAESAQRFESVALRQSGSVDPAAIAAILSEAGLLWTVPAFRENADVMDGYVWIIEARRNGTYRMVTRDNFRDASFETFALSILRAAGVQINEETLGAYARPSGPSH